MTFYKGQKWRRRKRAKHKSALCSVRTTKKQREYLVHLKCELAEKGYQIYPVATWFRRSAYDFVAVLKHNPSHLLVVRVLQRGKAEARYYASIGMYRFIKAYLKTSMHQGRLRWGRQLPANRNNAQGWRTFVSRNCQYELELLTDAGTVGQDA